MIVPSSKHSPIHPVGQQSLYGIRTLPILGSLYKVAVVLLTTASAFTSSLGAQNDPAFEVLYAIPPGETSWLLGGRLAELGDANGDGFGDFALRERVLGGGDGDSVRVYSGIDGQQIWRVEGLEGFGRAIDGVGDVNNDGYGDLLVMNHKEGFGVVRLYSGPTGALLLRVDGTLETQFKDSSAAGAGDVNADGVPDFIVGAGAADADPSVARVYSGLDGSLLREFVSPDGSLFGRSLDGAGDVDGDGHADVIIGGTSGNAWVYSGDSGALLWQFSGSGEVPDPYLEHVAGVGDVNQDGVPDMAVGDHLWEEDAGTIRMYSGADGTLLWQVHGTCADWLGWFVDSTGDVNGDGIPDLTASAPSRTTHEPGFGSVYVYSGKDGTTLWHVGGLVSTSVAGAGDVNGDGFADVLVSDKHAGVSPPFPGFAWLYAYQPGDPADPVLSTIAASGTEVGFLGTATITVTPRDASGADLGSGQRVFLSTSSGVLLGRVVDHGDGTYSQVFQSGVDSTPSVVSAEANGVTLAGTVTVTPAVPQSISLANGERTVRGNLVGGSSYLDTFVGDFESEYIEGRHPGRKHEVDHRWTVQVPSDGNERIFFLKAHHGPTRTAEDVHFAWSSNDSDYISMMTVDNCGDDKSYRTFALPQGTSGTVYIRVTDTDPFVGSSQDGVFVDHLGIASVPAVPTPGITVDPTGGIVTTEDGGEDTFTVVLDTPPIATVTLDVSTSEPAEGLVSAGAQGPVAAISLTFGAGDWNVPQTVTVTGVDDLIEDGDQSYTIVTDPAVSADPAYSSLDADDVSATNIDNDGVEVTVTAVVPHTIDAGAPPVPVMILGSGFQPNPTITLENGSGPEPTFTDVTWISDTEIAAMVSVPSFSGGPKRRKWDLRVTNTDPSGSTDILPNALTVVR